MRESISHWIWMPSQHGGMVLNNKTPGQETTTATIIAAATKTCSESSLCKILCPCMLGQGSSFTNVTKFHTIYNLYMGLVNLKFCGCKILYIHHKNYNTCCIYILLLLLITIQQYNRGHKEQETMNDYPLTERHTVDKN